MVILDCYAEQLSKVEWYIHQQAKQHKPNHLHLLKSVWGIGPILALTIIYEIGDNRTLRVSSEVRFLCQISKMQSRVSRKNL